MKDPRIETRVIPEGINTSSVHPLREFATLVVTVLLIVVLSVLALGLLAEKLVVYIPFETEQKLGERFVEHRADAEEKPLPETIYLQNLADKLLAGIEKNQPLAEGLTISVHYVDDETENAFAALGGHIFMHKGLIQRLQSENALAMVLAHEIAHVIHRHPLVATGRGTVIGLSLAALTGFSGSDFFGGIIGDATDLTLLHFSRDQETEADETALLALANVYGHVAGADQLFKVFIEIQREQIHLPQLLSTHPLSQTRIDRIALLADQNGWSVNGRVSPLPGGMWQ